MLVKLNPVRDLAQYPQGKLSLNKWLAPQIVAVQFDQIEGAL